MGKNTFNWSFTVNNLEVPTDVTYLKLTSPSGKIWEFNEKKDSNYIRDLQNCQVVTQVRNIKENLKVLDVSKKMDVNSTMFCWKSFFTS